MILFITEFVIEIDKESILLVQITKKKFMYFRYKHRFYGAAIYNFILGVVYENVGIL